MRTVREETVGELRLRLVDQGGTFIGLIFTDDRVRERVSGSSAEEVWTRLQVAAARSHREYVGYHGAIDRFRRIFPDGFRSGDYAARERDYKVAAKAKLDATIPLGANVPVAGHGEAALAVYRATNLLSPFETGPLGPFLRGPDADTFVRLAARFTDGDWAATLVDLDRLLRPANLNKWTVVTYLPFLWRPERHMYLKPTAIRSFAERVGHPFYLKYRAQLEPEVYVALLDLAADALRELEVLAPRDLIDVQSFVWVVAEYNEG